MLRSFLGVVLLSVVGVQCQHTQSVLETCTYSFVVPRPTNAQCTGSAADDNDILRLRLSQLEDIIQKLQDDKNILQNVVSENAKKIKALEQNSGISGASPRESYGEYREHKFGWVGQSTDNHFMN